MATKTTRPTSRRTTTGPPKDGRGKGVGMPGGGRRGRNTGPCTTGGSGRGTGAGKGGGTGRAK